MTLTYLVKKFSGASVAGRPNSWRSRNTPEAMKDVPEQDVKRVVDKVKWLYANRTEVAHLPLSGNLAGLFKRRLGKDGSFTHTIRRRVICASKWLESGMTCMGTSVNAVRCGLLGEY